MEHVGVREDHVRPAADLPASLRRGVAVVDRGANVRRTQLGECARLVLRERLRRIEIERPLLRFARDRVEHRQVEGERLSRRRAGGEDQVLAARGDVPGVALVLVEAVERKRSAQAGCRSSRERCDARLRGGDRLDVRELLALEQVVPGDGAGSRHSSAVNRVSCVPSAPRGARCGRSTASSPARRARRPPPRTRRPWPSCRSTWNATRTGAATRLPTAMQSISAACASSKSSSVARPADSEHDESVLARGHASTREPERVAIEAHAREVGHRQHEAKLLHVAHLRHGTLGPTGVPDWAEITPVEPDPVSTGEGSELVRRCLTIAGSDSGGGAGIQADLKAFAAAGCHGMSAIVALTAQNTVGVTAVVEVPPEFVTAQLEAVWSDIGVDAAKTGMLFSRANRDRGRLPGRAPCPARRRSGDDRELGRAAAAGRRGRDARQRAVSARDRRDAEPERGGGVCRSCRPRGATRGADRRTRSRGGCRDGRTWAEAVDHLYDGTQHVEIPVERHDVAATHGAGCTHSATLAAELAKGWPLEEGRAHGGRRRLASGCATVSSGLGRATARSTSSD